jgi:hypothetical protein
MFHAGNLLQRPEVPPVAVNLTSDRKALWVVTKATWELMPRVIPVPRKRKARWRRRAFSFHPLAFYYPARLVDTSRWLAANLNVPRTIS